VCYEQAFRMATQLLGDRTLRLNIANAKTLCWTRVHASSMQFTLSKPADIEYMLIISFHHPLFFQLAVLSMFFILYAYSFVTSFVILCQLSKCRIPTLCPAPYSPVPQRFSDRLDFICFRLNTRKATGNVASFKRQFYFLLICKAGETMAVFLTE
jgi:hypothetical protein